MEKIILYLNLLSEKVGSNNNYSNMAFRGQCNSIWGIRSSAARRLENNNISNKSITKIEFIEYHKIFLEEARQYGYNHQNISNRELGDLGLLAMLQHNGAATCLIDFTKNFLIALWFASEPFVDDKNISTDGKIFFIDLDCPEKSGYYKYIDSKTYSQKIENLLFNKSYAEAEKSEKTFLFNSSVFWVLDPQVLTSTILSQNSIFLFSINPVNDDDYKKIIVKQGDKEQIRCELDKYFNINTLTIFRDFYGFANKANNSKSSFYKFAFSKHLNLAKRYLDKKEYLLVIENALKGISCIEQAKSCTITKTARNHICNKGMLGSLYYFLAEGQFRLGSISDAEENYRHSIKRDSLYKPNSYYRLADICYTKGFADNKINIEDFEKALMYMRELYAINNNNVAYTSIIELLVILGRKDEYCNIINDPYKGFDGMSYNERYVYKFFEIIGDSCFLTDSNINNLIGRFKRTIAPFSIEDYNHDFFWDFRDIINWAKIIKNNNVLSFAEYLSDLQNSWLNDFYQNTDC